MFANEYLEFRRRIVFSGFEERWRSSSLEDSDALRGGEGLAENAWGEGESVEGVLMRDWEWTVVST